jgi:hypothetical protein
MADPATPEISEMLTQDSLPTGTAEVKPSTYTEAHRRYYLAHKAEILERDKASGLYERKYKAAYQRNREEKKAKALARYYAKKASPPAPSEPAGPPTA